MLQSRKKGHPRFLRPALLATLLLTLLPALLGCRPAATTGPVSPTEPSPASFAPAASSTRTASEAADADAWPRTVTDASGETIVIDAKPQRVVTLSLGLDEIVMALAGPERFAAISDIARSETSNIAAQAAMIETTVVGDLEFLIGLNPDLLLLDGFAQPDLVAQARNAGLTIVITDLHTTFEQHLDNIDFLSFVLGEEERGAALRAHLEQRADALAERVAAAVAEHPKPRVLHVTPSLHVPGADTTSDDIIIRAGGINVAAEAGLYGWQQLSLEKVLELAPDVIIHDEYDLDRLRSDILEHPGMQDVPALVADRVFQLPSRYLTTLSYWTLRASEELAQRLWPDAFEGVTFADFD